MCERLRGDHQIIKLQSTSTFSLISSSSELCVSSEYQLMNKSGLIICGRNKINAWMNENSLSTAIQFHFIKNVHHPQDNIHW